MIIREMGRRGLWSDTQHAPEKEGYVDRMLRHIIPKTGEERPTMREYLTQHPELPYYIEYNAKKNGIVSLSRGSIEYERAVMYLRDGGKSKDFVHKLLQRISTQQGRVKLKFSITASELLLLWPLDDLCPICKTTKMLLDGGVQNRASASLDRKVNEREYESGNCGWMCYHCNARKGNLTLEEVYRIAAWIRSAE